MKGLGISTKSTRAKQVTVPTDDWTFGDEKERRKEGEIDTRSVWESKVFFVEERRVMKKKTMKYMMRETEEKGFVCQTPGGIEEIEE
jgi:hypothetical protein